MKHVWVEDRTGIVTHGTEDTTDDSPGYARTSEADVLAMERQMVEITRLTWGFPLGTFGKLKYLDFECWTLELPWRNNGVCISCIPPGIYPLKPCTFWGGDGPGGKEDYPSYEISNVPGRSHIKIHIGNTVDNIKGCVILGDGFNVLNKNWGITGSRKSFKAFMEAMKMREALFINIHYPLGGDPWKVPKEV